MSDSASIVVTNPGGFRAEVRLSSIPIRPDMTDHAIVEVLGRLMSGLAIARHTETTLAEVHRQVEDTVRWSPSRIRVEFETRWRRDHAAVHEPP